MGIKEKGRIYGYIKQSDLRTGPCHHYQKLFHPSELISESTPLIDLLMILHDSPRIFVLECNRVTGIITRGDLQKAPVRIFLFGLITLLEMQLQRIIQNEYSDNSWTNLLKPQRLKKAKELLTQRQARNEDIGLVDCLQFCDKRILIRQIPKISEIIKGQSDKDLSQQLEKIEKLRNKLAHAQDIVSGSTWQEVINITKYLEKLLEILEYID